MATIDIGDIAKQMLAAALGELGPQAKKVKAYAELEMKKLAQTIAAIEVAHRAGKMTDEEARLLLDMQRNAARAVMATVKGMSLVAAERAVNAALGVVRDAVNTAMGIALV